MSYFRNSEAIACFDWGFLPTNMFSSECTTLAARWHINRSNGLSRRHKCDVEMTDGRQTDHVTEKCVGVDEIVCAARAIPL